MGTPSKSNLSSFSKRRLRSKRDRQKVDAIIRAAILGLMPKTKTIEVDARAQVAWHPAMRRDAVTKPPRHSFMEVVELGRV